MTAPKQGTPVKNWCFTLNNYDDAQVDHLKSLSIDNGLRYMVFGHEVGDSGTPHIQGYVQLIKKQRLKPVVEYLGGNGIHVSPAKGDELQNRLYCRKEGDRLYEYGERLTERQRTDIQDAMLSIRQGKGKRQMMEDHPDVVAKYPRFLNDYRNECVFDDVVQPDITLRDWQIELEAELLQPIERRKIIWIWSDASETGKTTFMEWMLLHPTYKGHAMKIVNFKKDDILFAYQEHKLLNFNIPRAVGEMMDTMCNVLELMSDGGPVLSTKYESVNKYVKSHIVVCANIPPPLDKLPKRFVEYALDPCALYSYKRIDHRS